MESVIGCLDPDKYSVINFEETELRLGLPGSEGHTSNNSEGESSKSGIGTNGKRGFLETVDLMLNLTSKEPIKDGAEAKVGGKSPLPAQSDPSRPPSKAQVVGWPPIRSFRKNAMAGQKSSGGDDVEKSVAATATPNSTASATAFVKVSVDGAPYLRKVDLKLYKSYHELSAALSKMVNSFPIGSCGSQGTKDLRTEGILVDVLPGSDYVPTYEDKEGDWMLVGDVPWTMFVDSCKRLRMMKGSEASGLGRGVEKFKNKS